MEQQDGLSLSPVERRALEHSAFRALYPPAEKIPAIEVENFPALGKLAALRFIEWAQGNPGGVISLPTGKTPEHFIKWVSWILREWETAAVRKELEAGAVDPAKRPDMRSLRFVQIDEFYPIDPNQKNSFHWYVRNFYIQDFGLDPAKAMLIDCSKIGLKPGESIAQVWPDHTVDLSLRCRLGSTPLERLQQRVLEGVDQWCQEYEQRIRDLGGIGFFLGGIGPDGHIGFNIRGSDHFSTTRLTPTNYETQAAAATDLGGIEAARKRLVITIGLGTIAYNPQCAAIILAAGAAKAAVVANGVQRESHILYPATALHSLPNARFYLTRGAAGLFAERRLDLLQRAEAVDEVAAERIVIDLAVARNKRLLDLSREDFLGDRLAAGLLEKTAQAHDALARKAHESLAAKIERGAASLQGARFLHTEPHHDDLMLGALPYIVRHVRSAANTHYFATLTSGFTAVTNQYMEQQLRHLLEWIDSPIFAALREKGYFNAGNEEGYQRDVWQFLDGVAGGSEPLRREGESRRLLRNLMRLYDESDFHALRDRVGELGHYFRTVYPGKKDPEHVQQLKGACREWEAECLWGYFGWNCSNVRHLRLGFYTGDIFTQEPTVDRDVAPLQKLLAETRPDAILVALDPEASGPDTHYKALQAMTEAVRRYEAETGRSDMKIIGYRNVWYRFHPSAANSFVPVSLNMFSIMQSSFMDTFVSQREASFPSFEHDGPFCELAQKIQVEQYQTVKTCLGREWFYGHPSPLIRASRGLVFLREMDLPEFYQRSRELKQATGSL